MKKALILFAVIVMAQVTGGCGLFAPRPTDGSEAYGQAHPDQTQPPSYMDPDSGYSSDNK